MEDGLEVAPAPPGSSEAPLGPGRGLILTPGTFATSFPGDGEKVDRSGEFWPWPRPGIAVSCGAPFLGVEGCGCGVRVVRAHCDRLECEHPYCEARNRKRRGADIVDRLEAGRRGRAVIYTVLTVPPARREAAADMKRWARWVRNLVSYLRKHHGLEYAVERSDPAGEDGETWHPHINLLWIRKGGRGFMEEEELEALKARWARIIGIPGQVADVYTQYSFKPGRIRFWASYLGRTWPRWARRCKYMIRPRWYGQAPRRPAREAGPDICPRCGCERCYLEVGSQAAAEELAARGYDHLLEEVLERRRHFKARARCSLPRFVLRISGEGLSAEVERG